MSSSAKIIHPPNNLRLKVGNRAGGVDPVAVAKAAEAVRLVSAQSGQWLLDEIVELEKAQASIRTTGLTPETAEVLHLRARDLKGMGATYQYPIVTRLAASLCRLTENPETRLAVSVRLIDAHVGAIRAVVRDQIQTDHHPAGRALADTLEAQVEECLVS